MGIDAGKLDQIEKRFPYKTYQVVVVTFGTANQDLDIQHNLKAADPEMIDYTVLQASGPAIVYHDTSPTRLPWAKGLIRLRSPITGLRARILLTVSSSPTKFEGGGFSDFAIAGALFERGRTVALGEWSSVPFNAGNFSGNGSMTWTLTSGNQVAFSYTLVGKTLFVSGYFNQTSVGGTLNTDLRVTIPGGFTANATIIGIARINDNGAGFAAGVVYVIAGATTINFQRMDSANWANATNTTVIQFSLAFPIQ